MAATALSRTFDRTRSEIIAQFRDRIRGGERNKLTRADREELTLLLLDDLIGLQQREEDTQDEIAARCRAEVSLLEEGYPQSTLNSTYLPAYTRVIKNAIAAGQLELTDRNSYSREYTKLDGSESGVEQRHYAFDYLTYDRATQVALRAATTANNNLRQDSLQPVELDGYIAAVMALVEDEQSGPEELAIAIAALTGRRHTEVVSLGGFAATRYPYQVHFEGQQKKAAAQSEGFDILALIPAADLLPVVERFRTMPEVGGLAGLGHDHPEVDAFNARVNRRVNRLFGDSGLVPVPEGFASVSVHRLRSLYGAIAIHFFCPNNRNPHRFLQHHLGHVLDVAAEAQNSRATDHYFHYYLVRQGKPITARGVKVAAVGMPPEAAESAPLDSPAPEATPTLSEASEAETAMAPLPKRASLRIDPATRDEWHRLLNQIAPGADNQAESMQVALERLRAPRPAPQANTELIQTQQQLNELIQAQASQAQSIAWLTQRLQAVEAENEVLRSRMGDTEEVVRLQAENQRLSATLDQFRQMLGMSGEDSRDEAEAEEVRAAPTAAVPALGVRQQDFGVAAAQRPQKPAVMSPVVTATAEPQPRAKRLSRAQQRAKNIFDAIRLWSEQHPGYGVAISPGFLKLQFQINQGAASEFCELFEQEIEDYHRLIGVTSENKFAFNRTLDDGIVEAVVEFVKNQEGT